MKVLLMKLQTNYEIYANKSAKEKLNFNFLINMLTVDKTLKCMSALIKILDLIFFFVKAAS
jgi:hypothetical protein